MTVYEDTPNAILQLMKDLDKAGFYADFTLNNGLEVQIKKIANPLIADFISGRKMF